KLTAGYRGFPIVNDVDLRIEAGTAVAVVGPNGAGKSTLLKAIMGLLEGTEGMVKLGDLDISGWKPQRISSHGMGYVPQVANVFPSMTVRENLEIGAHLDRSLFAQREEEVLAVFPDLKPALKRQAGTLSGGQRVMLAIGRVLMSRPKVILLDEPTAGLAPKYAARVWEIVDTIAKSGVGLGIVEQNVETALEGAQQVYTLINGRNAMSGSTAEVDSESLGRLFMDNLEVRISGRD
ncbi:MAG: ABC transporter ATP-binding protein, partial [Deinococcales bacterium]